jgi:hypothetical protein
MTPPTGSQPPPAGEVQWIFSWRRRTSRLVPIFLPVVVATLGLGVLLALVRVKVAGPQFEMERQGSVIYMPATGDGLAWAIRAKEAGPSLSRYEPSAWEGYPALEQAVVAASLVPALPHVPQLKELPSATAVQPLALAAKGEPVFPKRQAAAPPAPPPVAGKLVPVLYPLSPMGSSELPRDLPAVPAPLDPDIVKADWRYLVFIVRLRPDGGVAESLALNKLAGPGSGQLENWLRGVAFDPKLTANGDWIAVGIRFNNQPAHGTDDH